MGNDSARDPKRTKRADVLDEVEPRLCWGRSKTRGELEDTTWAALLSQKPGCARRGTANNHRPVGRAAALFGAPRRPCFWGPLGPKNLTPHYPSIM